MLVVYLVVAYLLVGVVIALPFVAAGIGRIVGGAGTVSLGARLLLVPGAVLLWPIVLRRWIWGGHRS